MNYFLIFLYEILKLQIYFFNFFRLIEVDPDKPRITRDPIL